MIGTQDVLIGLVLVLFFFGAKRLPELANSLGRGIKEFKKGVSGETAEETPKAADDGRHSPERVSPAKPRCNRTGVTAPAVEPRLANHEMRGADGIASGEMPQGRSAHTRYAMTRPFSRAPCSLSKSR